MKMKILPPTLRNPRRYIAFELISEKELGRDEIISVIWESCLRLHGECETSNFRLWLMKLWSFDFPDAVMTLGVLQCQRGYEGKVMAALTSAHHHGGKRLAFHVLGISGTIRSATQKFIKPLDKDKY
ncbi:Rpp14/Pop5 family protein [Methanothermobacter wolfeii]|uniref:Ribonuclease P protein component 2 n=1 Tax=Methanothermobacter wolfeii TaxID=145261 RepID=A0A9E7RRF8_METWO|nr:MULTISPECIES: Rpp14/Pop5 family protein [Methanothermobacter]UXH30986.1 ribonuclease P [Methanothermobacter wolfeii]SCM57424.1 Ribonuclease P protein component 2 {ECO:0000255/HAMAP-Rule:MF_00755} [Methanothermobacter wolfeii]